MYVCMNKMEDDVIYFLQISKATVDDADKYRVTISNKNDSSSVGISSMEVIVTKPKINHQ